MRILGETYHISSLTRRIPEIVLAAWQSVPAEFCDKYGMYFSERVNTFQGPTGRAVEVCFSRTRKLHFTTGWNAFFKENNLKVGDVLLFSLQAPACWWVRVVESHESS